MYIYIYIYIYFAKNSSSNVFTCHCNEPHLKKYINSDHGHTIIGYLNEIQFTNLKKLMKYDTKFRTLSSTNINNILKQFTYNIGLYIYKI